MHQPTYHWPSYLRETSTVSTGFKPSLESCWGRVLSKHYEGRAGWSPYLSPITAPNSACQDRVLTDLLARWLALGMVWRSLWMRRLAEQRVDPLYPVTESCDRPGNREGRGMWLGLWAVLGPTPEVQNSLRNGEGSAHTSKCCYFGLCGEEWGKVCRHCKLVLGNMITVCTRVLSLSSLFSRDYDYASQCSHFLLATDSRGDLPRPTWMPLWALAPPISAGQSSLAHLAHSSGYLLRVQAFHQDTEAPF